MRPNYSYKLLAAAEQLEAQMHHPPAPTADSLARQRSLYCGLGGMFMGESGGAVPSVELVTP